MRCAMVIEAHVVSEAISREAYEDQEDEGYTKQQPERHAKTRHSVDKDARNYITSRHMNAYRKG